jgi:hypothetical protein
VSSVTDFFTSTGGIFATVAAIVGLLAALQALVRPIVSTRTVRRRARASIELARPQVGAVAPSSNSCDLQFELVNTGGRPGIVTSMRLVVDASHPSTMQVVSVPEAPLVVRRHRVELDAATREYDVRARMFSADAPPLSFADGEAEAFVVRLVSRFSHHYAFHLEIDWYDAKLPHEPQCLRSDARSTSTSPSPRDGDPDELSIRPASRRLLPQLHHGKVRRLA